MSGAMQSIVVPTVGYLQYAKAVVVLLSLIGSGCQYEASPASASTSSPESTIGGHLALSEQDPVRQVSQLPTPSPVGESACLVMNSDEVESQFVYNLLLLVQQAAMMDFGQQEAIETLKTGAQNPSKRLKALYDQRWSALILKRPIQPDNTLTTASTALGAYYRSINSIKEAEIRRNVMCASILAIGLWSEEKVKVVSPTETSVEERLKRLANIAEGAGWADLAVALRSGSRIFPKR